MMIMNKCMRVTIIPLIAVMLLYSIAFGQMSELNVQTDAPNYGTGDLITVSGDVGGTVTGQPLLIQVFNPNGAAYRFDQIDVSSDGSYAYEFRVGGNLGVTGTYNVVVTYSGLSAETTFEFAAVVADSEVTIDGKTYKIRHHSGSRPSWVGNVDANTDNNSLIFALSNTEDETLEVELDKALIDTQEDCFIVLIDGVAADAQCTTLDDETTLLTVSVPAGSKILEIVGSFLIPEFGTIALVVLAAVVAVSIFATRKANFFGAQL